MRVEFRTGISDPVGYAGRWLHKAMRNGARVRVIGAAADLSALDQWLWNHDREGFLPHAMAGAGAGKPGLARTPVWLGQGEVSGQPPSILLNLGDEPPPSFADLERIVEVIGSAAEEAQAGRRRWAQYRARGIEPEHVKPAADTSDSEGG